MASYRGNFGEIKPYMFEPPSEPDTEEDSDAQQNQQPADESECESVHRENQSAENGKFIQEGEDEEFSTTLSVGDGRYLVDLGSPSEFIVDEECIIQLFKTCRECHRPCQYVRKQVKGLKLVVNQACNSCPSTCKWTNLLDDDDDVQINGKANAARGKTSSAMQQY